MPEKYNNVFLKLLADVAKFLRDHRNGLRAWSAMTRYIVLAMVIAASGFVTQLGKDGWSQMNSYDWTLAVLSIAAAGLTAAGAVMNKRWSDAETNEDKKL